MLKRAIRLVVVVSMLSSCREKAPDLPISAELAAEVLIDIHGAEAALQGAYGTTKDSLAKAYYEQIYTIYDIDSTTFSELMQIMRYHPERLEEVYAIAIERVGERRENIKDWKPTKKKD
ncbi:MAG: DUF4296 domain-containing protein [Bacteroidota bacterium]